MTTTQEIAQTINNQTHRDPSMIDHIKNLVDIKAGDIAAAIEENEGRRITTQEIIEEYAETIISEVTHRLFREMTYIHSRAARIAGKHASYWGRVARTAETGSSTSERAHWMQEELENLRDSIINQAGK